MRRQTRQRRDYIFGVINMVLGVIVFSLGWSSENAVFGVPAPIGGLIVFGIGAYLTLKGRGVAVAAQPKRRSDIVFGSLIIVIGLFLIVTGWNSDYSRSGLSAPALGAIALIVGGYFALRGLGRIGGSEAD